MNNDEIQRIILRIETILEVERHISISKLINIIDIKKEIVLIAIGYLLHDGKIYLDEKCQNINASYSPYSF